MVAAHVSCGLRGCWTIRAYSGVFSAPNQSNPLQTLSAVYELVTDVVDSFGASDFDRPTRAEAWTTQALLFHLLMDAQRALVAFAGPTHEETDTDAVTYWVPFNPRRSGDAGRALARFVEAAAAAYTNTRYLVDAWVQTSRAVVRLGQRFNADDNVRTQDHVLTAVDFISTLLVEATIHYVDITSDFPGSPTPPVEALGEVRRVLEGLLGEPLAAPWGDLEFLLKGTGRTHLTELDRAALGLQGALIPLLG